MEKVDRLGWAAGCVFESHDGTRVGVRVNDAAHLPELESFLRAEGWEPHQREPLVDVCLSLLIAPPPKFKGAQNYHILYSCSKRVIRTLDREQVFRTLRESLWHTVALTATRSVVLMAGVAIHKGRTLLLPSQAGAGRRTLLKALGFLGAEVWPESHVLVDSDGRVRRPGASQSRALDLVAITRFNPERKQFRPKKLTTGLATTRMFQYSLAQGQLSIPVLLKTCSGVEVVEGDRPEAEAAAPRLLHQLV